MDDRRAYRSLVAPAGLVSYRVFVKETDLLISTRTNLRRKALRLVHKYRDTIEEYISLYPDFLTSLVPLPPDERAPRIISAMLTASRRAGVGPMAAIAGAIAEFVGRELEEFSGDVILENGGDIYLNSRVDRLVGIYAGTSPLSGKISLNVRAGQMPLGVCTSSGTVGHSLSFGNTDAVVVLSPDTALADAAATAVGNCVRKPADIIKGLERAQAIAGVSGVVIIQGDQMAVWGDVNIA